MDRNAEAMTPLRQRAEQVAGGHTYCEDGWYSCPLAEDGCFNDAVPKDKCNCGYDQRVNAIHAALEQVVEDCAKIAEGCKPVAHGNVFRSQREQADKIATAIRQQEARKESV